MSFLKKIGEWLLPQDDMDLARNRPGRNDNCWCGSEKKYKRCHLDEDAKKISKANALKCKTSS